MLGRRNRSRSQEVFGNLVEFKCLAMRGGSACASLGIAGQAASTSRARYGMNLATPSADAVTVSLSSRLASGRPRRRANSR